MTFLLNNSLIQSKRLGKSPLLNEEWLKTFLKTEFEEKESKTCNKQTTKEWNHLVDIDDAKKAEASVIYHL